MKENPKAAGHGNPFGSHSPARPGETFDHDVRIDERCGWSTASTTPAMSAATSDHQTGTTSPSRCRVSAHRSPAPGPAATSVATPYQPSSKERSTNVGRIRLGDPAGIA